MWRSTSSISTAGLGWRCPTASAGRSSTGSRSRGRTGGAGGAPPPHAGEGEERGRASREQGLEGVVAKRLDSPYEPGRRTGAWIKIKHRRTAKLVVGGWMPGDGGRRGRLGPLLTGFHDDEDGPLRYSGRVGSGLREEHLDRLTELLEPLRRDSSPF